ncbi:MAG: metal-dependent hydrolase [Gemmataceae bacterium]|nr:metal-dependent hydrolase [Gemmataceae bacterium]
MVDNAPYLSWKHGGLTIEGYSRAAVQSYFRIPELKIGFDLGAHPWDFMGTPSWCVTHAHLDHIAALAVYVARRRMMKMSPPDIYLPNEAVEDVKKLLWVFQRLDRGRLPCNLHGLDANQEFPLSREHVVTTFATSHTIPSLGFLVWGRKNKLKEEYQPLSGDQIRDLRLSGTAVTQEVRTPLVAYTGDTSPAALDAFPTVYEAQILITEMSFIRSRHRREKIHKYGHMHLDDFVERERLFKNELIIVGHQSTRYHSEEVRRVTEKKIPPSLLAKMKIWI